MAQIKHHKVVSALPAELEPDSLYLVRNGGGFDLYATNNAGLVVAYPLNAPSAAGSFFSLVTVTATAAGQTSFTVPGGYTPGAVVVFLEGASLAPAHYTATNGTAIVLTSGAGIVVGTELVVLRLTAFQVADALPLLGTAADSSKLGGQLPTAYLNDMLSSLSGSEVAISAAATLTSSAFGRMHACSGTASNYSVVLPAASGNAGKLIGLRMMPGLTKLVNVTATASDLIDGIDTRVMWANECAVLLCTGSGWVKVGGKSLPMVVEMHPASSVSVAGSVNTKVPLEATIRDNTGAMADAAVNKRVSIPRPGLWRCHGIVYYQPGASAMEANHCRIHRNGTVAPLGVNIQVLQVPATKGYFNQHDVVLTLAAGDYIELFAYQEGGTRSLYVNNVQFTYLAIVEHPSW